MLHTGVYFGIIQLIRIICRTKRQAYLYLVSRPKYTEPTPSRQQRSKSDRALLVCVHNFGYHPIPSVIAAYLVLPPRVLQHVPPSFFDYFCTFGLYHGRAVLNVFGLLSSSGVSLLLSMTSGVCDKPLLLQILMLATGYGAGEQNPVWTKRNERTWL
jgi:hypothetical protein